MGRDCLLMLFVKNFEAGKVKTRLAESIGTEKALDVYRELVQITREVSAGIKCRKQVWYSDYIAERDLFNRGLFDKHVQEGDDLGFRMKKAFAKAFDDGFGKVVIIGSDCPDITTGLLEKAFQALNNHDAVIGPASDGGYYLIGFNKFTLQVFQGVDWSTPEVLSQTKNILASLNYSYLELPVHNDIDTVEDLEKSILMHA